MAAMSEDLQAGWESGYTAPMGGYLNPEVQQAYDAQYAAAYWHMNMAQAHMYSPYMLWQGAVPDGLNPEYQQGPSKSKAQAPRKSRTQDSRGGLKGSTRSDAPDDQRAQAIKDVCMQICKETGHTDVAALTKELKVRPGQAKMIANMLKGYVWAFSEDEKGCRLVQAVVDEVDTETKIKLAEELQGHVQEAIHSPHANHVLSKFIEALPVVDEVDLGKELEEPPDQAPVFARHRFGCRIICRLVEHQLGKDSTEKLVQQILNQATTLCCHSFARHVISTLLEKGTTAHRKRIIDVLLKSLNKFAQNRNGSYVLEQALTLLQDQKDGGNEDRARVAEGLVENEEEVVTYSRNQFGSYVIRTILHMGGGKAYTRAVQILLKRQQELHGKYGSRVLEELKNLPGVDAGAQGADEDAAKKLQLDPARVDTGKLEVLKSGKSDADEEGQGEHDSEGGGEA